CAKSGWPVTAQSVVNSGAAKRTRNSARGSGLGTVSITALSGETGALVAWPSWVRCGYLVISPSYASAGSDQRGPCAIPSDRNRIVRGISPTRHIPSGWKPDGICCKRAAMTYRVAIVGAGPSGFYAADGLLRERPDLRIDLIDRLPTPFGL